MKRLIPRLILSIVAILATIELLVPLDTLFGRFFPNNNNKIASIFLLPPDTGVIYKTPEFTIRVKTNSLGFRGRNYSIKKPANTIRLLAIGDSFTFGWGVSQDEVWTNVLETMLNQRYPEQHFEVLNFGKSGTGPKDYLETARQYVPLYKPDYLLLGLVEGDDLSQLTNWPVKPRVLTDQTAEKRAKIIAGLTLPASPMVHQIWEKVSQSLEKFYPHFYAFFSRYKVIDVRSHLVWQMGSYLPYIDEEEIKRYDLIDPEIQKMYLTGNLNPALLTYALERPDHFIKVLEEKNPLVLAAAGKLTAILKEIKSIGEAQGAKTIVIDIPYPPFVAEKYAQINKKMGLSYNASSWTANIPQNLPADSAKSAGVYFFPTLDLFRKSCTDCFYDFDNHLTAKGQRFLATTVLQYFSQLLQ